MATTRLLKLRVAAAALSNGFLGAPTCLKIYLFTMMYNFPRAFF